MSDNIAPSKKIYESLTSIEDLSLKNKSVIVIGAGFMGLQFCKALDTLGISDVTIISKSEENANKLAKQFNFSCEWGGYEKNIPKMDKVDLVIIATPVFDILTAAKMCVDYKQNNILLEKPGSLFADSLIEFDSYLKGQNVRVGYNRLVYPNLYKLKSCIEDDGGVTSCTFQFTEWLDSINFQKDRQEVYSKLGISNSLHPISMAFNLIGRPKILSSYQSGGFDWHKSGSTFVGSGVTESGIPFSYHADWESKGRWGVILHTKDNSYRLIPLEKLYMFSTEKNDWEPIDFKLSYPSIKQGIAEEISVMLDSNLRSIIDLPTLSETAELNKFANKIFGY